ncbi:hypothetical protein WN944_020804 [Citrus x changshan-huyou]|uniref:Uncharacterized protein n=1 Tax=Citrus x changshan-huyou TaxID=2935761 RepID=A0AAP0MVN4_9ROSI
MGVPPEQQKRENSRSVYRNYHNLIHASNKRDEMMSIYNPKPWTQCNKYSFCTVMTTDKLYGPLFVAV